MRERERETCKKDEATDAECETRRKRVVKLHYRFSGFLLYKVSADKCYMVHGVAYNRQAKPIDEREREREKRTHHT